MPNFGQVRRNEHLPAQIAATIGQEIASGNLKAGDKLPTEHELAKTFGVSRSVVREAIAQLRNEGLIDTRQGVGAFVLPPQSRPVLRIESAKLANPESFRSLFQLRVPLEVEAAGLAALQVLIAEDLPANATRMGRLFKDLLRHPAIQEVRGVGLMLAVDLGEADRVQRVVHHCLDHGVLGFWFLSCPTAFRIAPPLSITADEVREACTVILSALDQG